MLPALREPSCPSLLTCPIPQQISASRILALDCTIRYPLKPLPPNSVSTPGALQACQSQGVLQYSEALAFIRFLSLRCGSFRRAVISPGRLGWELAGSKACLTLTCMIKTVNKGTGRVREERVKRSKKHFFLNLPKRQFSNLLNVCKHACGNHCGADGARGAYACLVGGCRRGRF